MWEYFQIAKGDDGEKLVRCVKCLRISHKVSSSTSHLRKHLIKVHHIELLEKPAPSNPIQVNDTTTSNPSGTTKFNKVWECFELIVGKSGGRLARCNSCKQVFNLNASCTKETLRRHLTNAHQITVQEMEGDDINGKSGTTQNDESTKRLRLTEESQKSEWSRRPNMNSEVWKYFEVKQGADGKKLVRCLKCNKTSQRRDSSTNNLKYHLLNSHKIEFPEKSCPPKTPNVAVSSEFAKGILNHSTNQKEGEASGLRITNVRGHNQMRNAKIHKCPQCHREFLSHLLLKKHQWEGHNTKTESTVKSQKPEWVRRHNMVDEVWKYFEMKTESNGKKLFRCIKCHYICGTNGASTTSNLWTHLYNVHHINLSEKGASYANELSRAAADITRENSAEKKANIMSQESEVWKHFKLRTSQDGKKVVRCEICGKTSALSNASTSNLWGHLKKAHGDKPLVKKINAKLSKSNGTSETGSAPNLGTEWQRSVNVKPTGQILQQHPEVWECFELRVGRGGKKLARCDMCARIFVCKASASTLRRHLRTAHPTTRKDVSGTLDSYGQNGTSLLYVTSDGYDQVENEDDQLDDEVNNTIDQSVTSVEDVNSDNSKEGTKTWLKSVQSMSKKFNKTFRVAEMAEKMEDGDDCSVTKEEIQESAVLITKFLMQNMDGNVEMMSFEKVLEYLETKGHLDIDNTKTSTNMNMPKWLTRAEEMCKSNSRRLRIAELAGGVENVDSAVVVTAAEVLAGITKVGMVLTRDEGCWQQIMALEKIIQYVDSKTSK